MKITVFGDSIAAGLGVPNGSYPVTLARLLGADLCDYSVSGATIRDSLHSFRQAPVQADLYLIAHGTTEPIPRPNLNGLFFMPPRWRKLGWMDPRPFFSPKLCRRLSERFESAVRWRLKILICILRGPDYLLTKDEYAEAIEHLVDEIRRCSPTAKVLLLTPGHIDERFFRGVRSQAFAYATAARSIDVDLALSLQSFLRVWDDYLLDHFHPNQSGHDRIALGLAGVIEGHVWRERS